MIYLIYTHLVLGRRISPALRKHLTAICQRLCNSQAEQAEIFSPVLQQAFAHHSTHSALEASTFHSFAYLLCSSINIARASVEQNSIGHT
jgi:hypothetical protein